jgi:hypothetical protein
MNRILRTAVVAVAALGVALVASAPASAAATDRGVDAVKKAVTTRIDKRLAALKKFDTALAGAKQVQAAHRSTLDSLIDDQTAGLTTLRAKVQHETTRAALKTDAKAMVQDYRVFLLTGPKVRLTAAIDTELAAADKLRKGNNVDEVAKSLAGKVDTLLALKPGPDGDAIKAGVQTIRKSAKDARATLKSIRNTK